METGFLDENDIESCMALVRRVKDTFPGLETEEALDRHRLTTLKFVSENRALCVKERGCVIGVLLFSVKHNMICFLAVDPDHRRKGAARALLGKAISLLDRSSDIIVDTFCDGDERAPAARSLYLKFGFEPDIYVENFGCRNQRFVLKAK